jgi:DNA repair exonuclease SbcCD ATPase subunit
MTTNLSTLHGCLEELEACSTGLTYFDHLFARVLDDLDQRRLTWESIEAEAAKAARQDAPKAATATEIKGLMTQYVERRSSHAKARDQLREAERRKEKIDRWTRTLEKRIGAAQSAKGIHEQLAEGGGG